MPWWIWFLFGLALLVVEMTVPGGLVAVFFGAGALVVALLTAVGATGPAWIQWLLFAALSVVSLALLRRRLRTRIRHQPRIDDLTGETAFALDLFQPGGYGRVELRGTTWSARNCTDSVLPRGQRCRVERVHDLTLWIAPEPNGASEETC